MHYQTTNLLNTVNQITMCDRQTAGSNYRHAFDHAKPEYEIILRWSGYTANLDFQCNITRKMN